jgi:hypothetical protein
MAKKSHEVYAVVASGIRVSLCDSPQDPEELVSFLS